MVPERGAGDRPFVVAAQAGDAGAFATLFDRWFDRVFDVAYGIVRNRDTAAEVAQEVFLAAWRGLSSIERPESFGGWLLRTSRNKALNRLERERRSVAAGDEEIIMGSDRLIGTSSHHDPGAELHQAESHDLVWAAARVLGERDASVLDLHLRHGLGAPEIGEALGVSANNAHQILFRLKGKLAGAIRSFVLWRGGAPACPDLTSALRESGRREFDATSARVIERHASSCSSCTERQRLRLSPEALFAAVPLLAAGAVLKAKAAAALEAAGVPARTGAEGPAPTGPGEPPTGSAAGPSPPATLLRRKRRLRRAATGVVAALVVAVVIAVAADPAGHDDRLRTAPAVTSTRDSPATATPLGDTPGVAQPSLPATAGGTTTASPSGSGPPPVPPRPRGTASPPPSLVSPSVVPPTPPQPGSTTTQTTPPPPVIKAFTATPAQNQLCGRASAWTLAWTQAGGTAAQLSASTPGVQFPGSGGVNGPATACVPRSPTGAPQPATFVLTVSGPGGSTTAKAQV